MRVLAISGSLRRDSHNTRLLRAAAELSPSGVELELYDPAALKQLPPYDADDDVLPVPAEVERLRAAVARADALLVATPEYNGTLPGQLKHAIDWASRPFGASALKHKPAAVIGASTGLFGAVWAQAEARKALGIAGAHVLEDELPVGQADDAFALDGRLADEEIEERLRALLGELAGATAPMRAAA